MLNKKNNDTDINKVSNHRNLDYIDALRAIAVMLVCFIHLGNYADKNTIFHSLSHFGKYGVQLFFVMSAFTLCISISKIDKFSNFNYPSFLLKRFFRIAPMYYLGIIFYGIYSLILYSNFRQVPYWSTPSSYTFENIIANIFFLNGIHYPSINNIVPGGWSIGCEFIFYALFPLIYFTIKNNAIHMASAISASIILSSLTPSMLTFLGFMDSQKNNEFSYYFIANQLPCFLIGIHYFKNQFRLPGFRAMATSAAVLILCLFIIEGKSYSWILSPIIASLISVILACLFRDVKINKFLKDIGKCSFSIYLIHFVFVWITAKICIWKFNEILESSFLMTILYAFVFSLTWLVSKVTYKFIELPFINIGKRLAKT